ncbi:MAG: histidine kinase [Niastella sp.]|nr:histidine kinase [Niastella sp.]
MKRKYIVLLHVAAWLLLIINDILPNFGLNAYPTPQAQPKSLNVFLQQLTITIGYHSIDALCFYGSSLVVAPYLFLKKRYGKALLLAILLLAVMVAWRGLLEFGFFKPVLDFDNYFGKQVPVSYYVMNIFWYYFPKYFVYGLVYFFAESWVRNRNRQEALQREKLTTELAFLRSQINPHFLFNTINDIYALTYQKSDQAPEALLKLSELLRYMLREGAGDFVALQSEIDYLNNLVELQRIGAKGNAYIHFEIEGYVGSQQVASLLFVAFVENAFKHGILNDPAHPVSIHLQASSDRIDFTVRNKYNNSQKDKTPGIGLANVKRRLELLYPGKHNLQITEGTDYMIHLTLQLAA